MKALVLKAQEIMNDKLKDYPHRLAHCYGVAKTAKELALIYHVNLEAAELVGLFHDYAKYDDIRLQKEMIDPIIVKRYEDYPVMYHAYAAAHALRMLLDVEDEAILSAIRCHVWGKPHMTTLDKILFVADYCEPNRTFSDRDGIYELARHHLDEAVCYCMKTSIEYLKQLGRTPSPESMEAYRYYMEVTRGITE